MYDLPDAGTNPLGRLIIEVFRANGALLAEGDRLTSDLGLTSARWQVLGALEIAGRPLTVAQIAREMGLARQSVQRVVNGLRKTGHVSFCNNPDHKRAKLVAVATKGHKTFGAAMQRQTQWARRIIKAANASDRRIRDAELLLRQLRKVIDT